MDRDAYLAKIGIPSGDYCYDVVEYTHDGRWKKIRHCPFWYGFRPNGGCLIHGWDVALGDACKSCGWREDDYID